MVVINPVILCGGKGTRLWPLSRAHYPKQYLALFGGQTLLQATAARITGPSFNQPMIICNEEHRFLAAEQLRSINITPDKILLENQAKNTAPAIAVACLLQQNPDQVLVVVRGTATITKGVETLVLQQNQSLYIAIGEQHRIENLTTEELHLIEVQSGGLFSRRRYSEVG